MTAAHHIDINNTPLSKHERMRMAMNDPYLIQREQNDRSLYEFIKWGWSEVSPDKYQDNKHIPYMCKILQKAAKRVGEGKPKKYDIIFNVPPGTSKTRVISILFQVWCWTKWLHLNFITASHGYDLSAENSDWARELIKSEKFQKVYPEIVIRQDKDNKTNFKVASIISLNPGRVPRTKNGGTRYTTSVKASKIGIHAHIQICDDLINPREALSDGAIKTANNFLDLTLSGRKTNRKITLMILVMQRLAENDPTGHLIKKKGKKIKLVCLPGEIRNYRKFVRPKKAIKLYTKDDLLDPVRLGWKELRAAELDLGQYGYAGQIGQNPTPPGGGIFKVDNIQVIMHPINPVNYVKCVRSWDKAGTADGGAYTAGVKMWELTSGRFLIEHVKRGQWDYVDREPIIKQTAIIDDMDDNQVEVVIEQEGGSGGKESADATVKNLAGHAVYKDIPKGKKELRADPFATQVKYGNVLMMNGDWNQEYLDELRLFPFGTYKDQVDASSQAFARLTGMKEVERII